MNRDWKDGFAEGFREGYEAANNQKVTRPYMPPPLNVKTHCDFCGLDLTKPSGYVCYNNSCTHSMRVTSVVGATGAVGAVSMPSYPTMADG